MKINEYKLDCTDTLSLYIALEGTFFVRNFCPTFFIRHFSSDIFYPTFFVRHFLSDIFCPSFFVRHFFRHFCPTFLSDIFVRHFCPTFFVRHQKSYLSSFSQTNTIIIFSVRKQDNSEIWPYLDNLPKSYDTPLEFWPKKYNQFLMHHVIEARQISIDDFNIRFDRINKTRDVVRDFLYSFPLWENIIFLDLFRSPKFWTTSFVALFYSLTIL